MIGVVVRREQLAKQAVAAQATGQLIEYRRLATATFGEPALEVTLHRFHALLGADLVHVEREAVSVQAQSTFLARAVHVRTRETRARDAQRDELRSHAVEREGHAAVDDHRSPVRPEVHAAERSADHDRRVDAALDGQLIEAHAAFAQTLDALFPAGDQQVRGQGGPVGAGDRIGLGERERVLTRLQAILLADLARRPSVARRRDPRRKSRCWRAHSGRFAGATHGDQREGEGEQDGRARHRPEIVPRPAGEAQVCGAGPEGRRA